MRRRGKAILIQSALLVSVVMFLSALCACSLFHVSIQPPPTGTGVDIVQGGQTNSIPASAISAFASEVAIATGHPELASITGVVISSLLAFWAFWERKKRKDIHRAFKAQYTKGKKK